MADKLNGLIFSEFLVDNVSGSAFDTDGDGTSNKSDEFIELQNTTGGPISLDGYELWSDDGGFLHSFGPGDTIGSGQTATIVGEYDGTPPAGYYDAGYSDGTNWLGDGEHSHDDTIYLVNTSTGEYIAFSYGDPSPTPSPPPGFPGTSQSGSGESIESNAPNGVAFTRDANGDWVEGSPDPGTPGTVCFTAGTRIATPYGERPVEDLRVGDLVTTHGSGAQKIRWIACRTFGQDVLSSMQALRPIAIEPHWTGLDRRLMLSPQHAMLVRSSGHSDRYFARAAQLARMKGGAVRVAHGIRSVTYVHFMLSKHEIVFANGVATESFYPGAWAVETLSAQSKLSLIKRFPGCDIRTIAAAYGPPKVPYARGRDLGERLADLRPETQFSLSGLVTRAPNSATRRTEMGPMLTATGKPFLVGDPIADTDSHDPNGSFVRSP